MTAFANYRNSQTPCPHNTTDQTDFFNSLIVICILASLACRSDDRAVAPFGLSPEGQVHALLRAAEGNDEERLRELIDAGVDIDLVVDSWGTALHQAVFADDLDAVRLLVKYGGDANKGIADGITPLHEAALSESEHAYEIVEILVSHGADVNAKVRDDNPEDMWAVFGEGCTPLHHAVGVTRWDDNLEFRSNKAVVELLLAHDARVDEKDGFGDTPLFNAASLDVMELLIEHGADVNARNSEDGSTVLHGAAAGGYLDVAELLLEHGADLHARDFDGETPLHVAALAKDHDMVRYLVERGAALHTPSKRGETPQDFLDEPDDKAPVILPDSKEQVFSLIVTDGLEIRWKLKAESIDYDRLWFPAASDIKGIRPALRKWLTDEAPRIKDAYIDHDYIVSHLDQYDRQYAGFVKDGTRYILCNMVEDSTDPALRSPRNRFSGMFDGGCSWFVVVLEAQTRQVVWCRCNNM